MNKGLTRPHAVNIQNDMCMPAISAMIRYDVVTMKANKLISTKTIVLPRAFTFVGNSSLSKVNGNGAKPNAYVITNMITPVVGIQTRSLVFI